MTTIAYRPIAPKLRNNANSHWYSRLVVAGVMATALSVYVGGIFWFGQGLADDMRAGVREVPAGVLIRDLER